MQFVQGLAKFTRPLVDRQFRIARMCMAGTCDAAAGTPAHHRGQLFTGERIDEFSLGGYAAEPETAYLGVDRNVQQTDRVIDFGQAETKPCNTRSRRTRD